MKHLLAVVTVVGLSASAYAQGADFATADANQDGAVTFEELQAVMTDVTQEQFDSADADSSGDLSEEEFGTISGS